MDPTLESDFLPERPEIEAESMGWQLREQGGNLHTGMDATEVVITGQATPAMAGMNVLWVA